RGRRPVRYRAQARNVRRLDSRRGDSRVAWGQYVKLAFTKMHGTGNDFVVLDRLHAPLPDPAGVARQVCDRRLGIGADQLLLVEPSPVPEAEFRMAIYNADGSRVEMCGNGIRCFAKYLR